jgi:hypothetical protein
MAFNLSDNAPMQNRTAASIIGSCPEPSDSRFTFNDKFADLPYIAVNWGGEGLTPPTVGAPGSGDLNGDGAVTMDEATIAARAAMGLASLTSAETAALDMDFDGVLTMTDVMIVVRKAAGMQ